MGKDNLFGSSIQTVGIAAPASACDPEQLRTGIGFLENSGWKVIPGKNLFRKGRFSYLSADDSLRIEDFNALAENPAVDAILCARGGYGTPRILNEINYSVLKERNLPVIGFSDITALHLAMIARKSGVCAASQMAARLPEAVKDRKTLSGMNRTRILIRIHFAIFLKVFHPSVLEISPHKTDSNPSLSNLHIPSYSKSHTF